MTSTERPPAISWQRSHVPHGSAVGPFSHDSAFARMRAALVLPTPRAPVNRNAWCTRFCAMAFDSVRATCSWPTSSENRWGRYLRASTRYDIRTNLLRTVALAHTVLAPRRWPRRPSRLVTFPEVLSLAIDKCDSTS